MCSEHQAFTETLRQEGFLPFCDIYYNIFKEKPWVPATEKQLNAYDKKHLGTLGSMFVSELKKALQTHGNTHTHTGVTNVCL